MARQCISYDPWNRPSFKDIVVTIKEICQGPLPETSASDTRGADETLRTKKAVEILKNRLKNAQERLQADARKVSQGQDHSSGVQKDSPQDPNVRASPSLASSSSSSSSSPIRKIQHQADHVQSQSNPENHSQTTPEKCSSGGGGTWVTPQTSASSKRSTEGKELLGRERVLSQPLQPHIQTVDQPQSKNQMSPPNARDQRSSLSLPPESIGLPPPPPLDLPPLLRVPLPQPQVNAQEAPTKSDSSEKANQAALPRPGPSSKPVISALDKAERRKSLNSLSVSKDAAISIKGKPSSNKALRKSAELNKSDLEEIRGSKNLAG